MSKTTVARGAFFLRLRVQSDGTWVNTKNDRWMEGMAMLCTCYAMTALELCK